MSTAVFPTFRGQGWTINRTSMWRSGDQEATSGKEVLLGYWSYPRYQWDLLFNFLRSDLSHQDMQALFGFYNLRLGKVDSFLYQDQDDNAVTGQVIGIGSSGATAFQMVRSFGGNVEPVLAPNVVSAVYLNGVLQAGANYTVSPWGSLTPGIITFNAAPADTVVVSADFTYYFPVHFMDDQLGFSKFVQNMYENKKVSLVSFK